MAENFQGDRSSFTNSLQRAYHHGNILQGQGDKVTEEGDVEEEDEDTGYSLDDIEGELLDAQVAVVTRDSGLVGFQIYKFCCLCSP